jgi:hypothetical protein
MILTPTRGRLFGSMLPGTFKRTESGWTALLDVGPNCSEDELLGAAHRFADRLTVRHAQVQLTYVQGQVAGLARLWINLVDKPRTAWTPASEIVDFEMPTPRLSDGSCLLEGNANPWATAADCGCEDCQWLTADPVGWKRGERRHDAITQEVPVVACVAPDTLLLEETDMPGATPIVNHKGEDIQVLTGEDRGPRTTTEDPTEDHSPTPSEVRNTGVPGNPESGGEVPVLVLLQGGINASMAPGPWDKKYARPIVQILALGGSMTARQIGIAIGCKTPRIVHGTLTELQADGWVRADGKTRQGHVTWTTDRDPAEMPQDKEETA